MYFDVPAQSPPAPPGGGAPIPPGGGGVPPQPPGPPRPNYFDLPAQSPPSPAPPGGGAPIPPDGGGPPRATPSEINLKTGLQKTAQITVRTEGTNTGTARELRESKKSIKKTPKKKSAKRVAKKVVKMKREKMNPGDAVKSEGFKWRVSKLLGSGGFGDVYKVKKEHNTDGDTKEYAMKTEMVVGAKRMLRLKIEVTVLHECHDNFNKNNPRSNFVHFVDRGITDKFKFLVMGLVGPSLDDIRRQYLLRQYSRSTAMQSAIQTLASLKNLHSLGWLHRDIKPQNFAVGLAEFENIVYMLDFGIARKIWDDNTKEIKIPRKKVQFLGTPRFASRACHKCEEQGRKDDLETWIFMVYDLFDYENGIAWKRAADKNEALAMKEGFFKHKYPKVYKLVPKDMKKLLDYCGRLTYFDMPNYELIKNMLIEISDLFDIKLDKKLDWMGKLKKKPEVDEDSDSSSDNQQSGSE